VRHQGRRLTALASYPCRLEGSPTRATIDPETLTFPERKIPWVDVDGVILEDARVVLSLADGTRAVVSHLAREHDDFVLKLRAARNGARRAALLQWTGDAPIDEYDACVGDDPVRVVLFADGLTVEGLTGVPQTAPFGLVDDVARDGYDITVRLRGLAPVAFGKMGKRTDEFVLDVAAARADLARRTGEAYAQSSADLAGFTAPAGWAVDASGAGQWWSALRAAVAGADHGAEIDTLAAIAGPALRLGLATLPDGGFFPFALAPAHGNVAVEGASADEARATYVFRTDDVDRLNAALLLTSFRREAIFLPDNQLGRWALAVRTLDVVRWARAALVQRIVHDDQWDAHVRAALS
jgi:hypothetical protein